MSVTTENKTGMILTQRPSTEIPAIQWRGDNLKEVEAWWKEYGWQSGNCYAKDLTDGRIQIIEWYWIGTPRRKHIAGAPVLDLNHWAIRERGIRYVNLDDEHVKTRYMPAPWVRQEGEKWF